MPRYACIIDAICASQDILDPKDLDLVLTEIALISQRTNYFQRFLKSKISRETTRISEKDMESTFSSLISDLNNGKNRLGERVDELMKEYLIMEEYFIRKSVEKAMRIDKYEDGATSTCVDDSFFILKQGTSRFISSMNVESLGVFLSMLSNLLENDYFAAFQKKLNSSFSNLESRDSRVGFMILLNNIDVSCDYMGQLAENIAKEIQQLGLDKDRDRMKASLGLFEEHSKTFRDGLKVDYILNEFKSWIDNLLTHTVRPKIKFLFQDAYQNIRYVLNDEEYAQQDANELFLKRFITGFTKTIRIYKVISVRLIHIRIPIPRQTFPYSSF